MTTNLNEIPPPIGEAGESRLPAAALRYARIESLLGFLIFIGVGAALVFFIKNPDFTGVFVRVVLPLVALWMIFDVLIYQSIQFKNYSYTITPDYVYRAKGRFFRRTITISVPQILNIGLSQGPLLKMQGLVYLHVTCITESEKLGPLLPEAAQSIRASILESQVRGKNDG
jgi:membrane protein YdbS with pleckstrin-like domain